MIADDVFAAAIDKPELPWERLDGAQLLDRSARLPPTYPTP